RRVGVVHQPQGLRDAFFVFSRLGVLAGAEERDKLLARRARPALAGAGAAGRVAPPARLAEDRAERVVKLLRRERLDAHVAEEHRVFFIARDWAAGALIRLTVANGAEEELHVEAAGGELLRQLSQQLGVRGNALLVHIVDRVDDARAEHLAPD